MGGKNKKKIFLVGLLLVISFSILAYLVKSEKIGNELGLSLEGELRNDEPKKTEDKVIVQSDGEIQKVQISTGNIEHANLIEQEDFSEFEGLPKLGIENGRENIQANVILSLDKSKAIVTIVTYDANVESAQEQQEVLSSVDYVCEVSKKNCQPTEILSQNYEGFSPEQQKNSELMWLKWDSVKNLIFGHLFLNELGDSSPVYICQTEKKTCISTVGYDSKKISEARAVVPSGTFNPELDRFVMVSQHDTPNLETGKSWELLVYSAQDLTKPMRSYDISAIIDRNENVAYDSVLSVSWSSDEKKLAIGTSRNIFILDLESGGLSLAYIAPFNENGDYYWDTSSLYLSPDAKYIAFVDSPELASDEEDEDTNEEESVNVLKRIEIGKNNTVTSMYSGRGLSLEF